MCEFLCLSLVVLFFGFCLSSLHLVRSYGAHWKHCLLHWGPVLVVGLWCADGAVSLQDIKVGDESGILSRSLSEFGDHTHSNAMCDWWINFCLSYILIEISASYTLIPKKVVPKHQSNLVLWNHQTSMLFCIYNESNTYVCVLKCSFILLLPILNIYMYCIYI